MEENRTYIAIDLKSFYASVECVERQLDPLATNLVVADAERTEKTICLAVSPSLKAYGISGRARLFEVIQRVKEVNARRRHKAPGKQFAGSSYFAGELKAHPELEAAYIIAPPRMAFYMEYSTIIYNIYLDYFAPEDIHVYSIDEVFLDVTDYRKIYGLSPKELASRIILDVLSRTGITAAAGIGTNLYLCKVAMDIVAKHVQPDKDGVCIAQLDEMSYRKLLWGHRPLTDFWRVGPGYQKKLEAAGLFTMGDIARCSLGGSQDYYNEDLLYGMFGVNAELLIDHAWGWEPTTIAQVKAYQPEVRSVSSGQVLQCPYDAEKGRLIVREMTEQLVLDLVGKRLVRRIRSSLLWVMIPITWRMGKLRMAIRGKWLPTAMGGRFPSTPMGRQTLAAPHLLPKPLWLPLWNCMAASLTRHCLSGAYMWRQTTWRMKTRLWEKEAMSSWIYLRIMKRWNGSGKRSPAIG